MHLGWLDWHYRDFLPWLLIVAWFFRRIDWVKILRILDLSWLVRCTLLEDKVDAGDIETETRSTSSNVTQSG